MSLTTPSKIRELQIKLYRKAKNEPGYRFYMLYDKIYREDILAHAYALARANQGAPGVDGQTFERIESAGVEEWLTGIRQELRNKTYQPQPVRRVIIPKPGGGGAAARDSDYSGPGGADRSQDGDGTDFRGGFGTECLWLPTEAECAGRHPRSA